MIHGHLARSRLIFNGAKKKKSGLKTKHTQKTQQQRVQNPSSIIQEGGRKKQQEKIDHIVSVGDLFSGIHANSNERAKTEPQAAAAMLRHSKH